MKSILFIVLALLATPSFALDDLKHKPFFDKLVTAYQDASSVSANPQDFKAREQVWLGECVSEYDFQGPYYSRREHFLPVIRHKTAPGEPTALQFAAIDVGGNPYDSKIIKSPADAIWFLRGEAGSRISLAYPSVEEGAWVADYYDEDRIALKEGNLAGEKVYLFAHLKGKTQISEVCYFNERLL